jgi:AcrR family transcriptional regulator
MKSTAKLSSEERRAAIIQAVRGVFAEKGFHGTTTRELARAAGVSEALLFKHFPNKEALFSAMQLSCCNEQDLVAIERLTALEPSASTLVLVVYFLVSRIVGQASSRGDAWGVQNRLMLRSLAEDGEFARVLMRKLSSGWVPKAQECLEAAIAASEASPGPVLPSLGPWFAHHIAAMIRIHSLPTTPAVEYAAPADQLVEQAVWFALRGMGLKEEAIRRYFTPQALALLTG